MVEAKRVSTSGKDFKYSLNTGNISFNSSVAESQGDESFVENAAQLVKITEEAADAGLQGEV